MAANERNVLVRFVRGLAVRSGGRDTPDSELLRRFVAAKDDAAFSLLVKRHGPMVLSLCRRLLRNDADAQDAFRATFLVLAQKAHTLRSAESVGNWLYGVARRTALKARTGAGRRRKREGQARDRVAPDPATELSLRDAQLILDEELARLGEEFRAPVVLCCLEGLARDEAAQHLGWPRAQVKNRLEKARELLRKRLTRRGLTLSAGLAFTLLVDNAARASVPAPLATLAVQAAVMAAQGKTISALLPANVCNLAKGVMNAMVVSKLRFTAGIAVAILSCISLSLFLCQAQAQENSLKQGAAAGGQAKAELADKPAATGRIFLQLNMGLVSVE